MSVNKGIALITGSAQGLGRSIALRLAKDGFDIALNDVASKRDQLGGVADDIKTLGRRTHLVTADVALEEEVRGMIEDVVKELGGLDVMVANAGVSELSSIVDTKLEEWERVMAVNARGQFLCYKYAAQQMIKQGRGGRIIGASSILGKVGIQGNAAYSASKFAVRGLTQTAALELGPHAITVNAYAPGLFKTQMTDDLLAKADPEMLAKWGGLVSRKPIMYDGQPEDVASVVSYLASKEAHFITGKSCSLTAFPGSLAHLSNGTAGQCINIDGGILMS